MAWHMGYPLSQTLFTSLYIERLLWPEPKNLDEARFDRGGSTMPDTVLHQVLRPFCLGLIKTCDFVYKTVAAEHYYEVNRVHNAGFMVLISIGRRFCTQPVQSRPAVRY